MKSSSRPKIRTRRLKLESLEERCLMAVWSGLADGGDGGAGFGSLSTSPAETGEIAITDDVVVETAVPTAEIATTAIEPNALSGVLSVPPSALTNASDGVTAVSAVDITGDGFIGPTDYAALSKAWFTSEGDANWNAAADITGDGFIGPTDHAELSRYWFKNVDTFPNAIKEYHVTPPNNLSAWQTVGGAVTASNGVLTLDAQNGPQSAVCPFEFGDAIRLTAEFSSASLTGGMECGFLIGVQDTGEAYFIEIRGTSATLFYRDADQNEIELSHADGFTLTYAWWTNAWLQIKDGQLSFGLRGETLLCVSDHRLTSGRIGFFADRGLVSFRNMVVDPSPEEVSIPPTESFVYVTQGTATDNYAAFPDVCRLADGRLMAVFYIGYTHVSVPCAEHPKGGRVCCSFSSDEGRTWTTLRTVVDTAIDDRDPSVVQLSDGRILCNFFTLSGGVTNVVTVESSDGGLTWSSPVVVYAGYVTSSPVRILSNGNLIMPLYRQADGTAWGAVGISQDNGKTWSDPITIPRGKYRLDAETDIVELSDGTLYAIEREQMAYSISTDGGRSWSVSKDVGFFGQSPYLLRTSDGIVILAQRNSDTSFRFSYDECQTWSDSIVVDSVKGAYPSMVELSDGSVLIIYYEEGNASNVRARRFMINDNLTVSWRLL